MVVIWGRKKFRHGWVFCPSSCWNIVGQSRKWIIVSLLLDVTVQKGNDRFKWQLSSGCVVGLTSVIKCTLHLRLQEVPFCRSSLSCSGKMKTDQRINNGHVEAGFAHPQKCLKPVFSKAGFRLCSMDAAHVHQAPTEFKSQETLGNGSLTVFAAKL